MCSHSLLDQKINNVLSISNDQAILKAIQSIIQNMLATEDPSQQQLHFLQSCGFGGLWRFAGPFTKTSVSEFICRLSIRKFLFRWKLNDFCWIFQYNLMGESSELFVNCLEAMVETCLPVEDAAGTNAPPRVHNLSCSLSSLTLNSPTDKGNLFDEFLHFSLILIRKWHWFSYKLFVQPFPPNRLTVMMDSGGVWAHYGAAHAVNHVLPQQNID